MDTAIPLKSKGLGVGRVFTALRYATEGLVSSIRHEAAFRQELILAAVLIPLALWLPIDPAAKVWLVASMVLVLVVELINSAIEAVVDYISLSIHPLAKRAKDMGSAAVLLSIINLIFAWGYLLYSYRADLFGLE